MLDRTAWSAGVSKISGKLVADKPGTQLICTHHYVLYRIENDQKIRIDAINQEIEIESAQPTGDEYANVPFSLDIRQFSNEAETAFAAGSYRLAYHYGDSQIYISTFTVD